MPKKKEIDSHKLIKMIKDEIEQKEIMNAFGFKNSSQLKIAYTNALMELGQVPEIKTRRKSSARKQEKEAVISKRGSLVVPRQIIEE